MYDCWSTEKYVQKSQPNNTLIESKEVFDSLTLIFSKGKDRIFEWHFQKEHFDFNRIEHSKKLPYKNHYSGKFNIPETHEIESEANFLENFFGGNLESIEGKCSALYKIFWFKNRFNNNSLDYLIRRWIEPTGKYFAGWEDFHTNIALLQIMREECNLSVDTIFDMNIPKLTAHMVLMEVNNHRPSM